MLETIDEGRFESFCDTAELEIITKSKPQILKMFQPIYLYYYFYLNTDLKQHFNVINILKIFTQFLIQHFIIHSRKDKWNRVVYKLVGSFNKWLKKLLFFVVKSEQLYLIKNVVNGFEK